MSERRWLSIVVSSLLALVLAACTPTNPTISSIQSEPRVAKEGGPVAHLVGYSNPSQSKSYHDVVVTVRYSKYLRFQRSSSPYPDTINEGQLELTWELGELDPDEKGSIRIEFELDSEIPRDVYELPVTAEISGTDAEGRRTTRERTGKTLIEGHPTPTPTVTDTPRPTSTTDASATATQTRVMMTPARSPTPRPATAIPTAAVEDCWPYDPRTLTVRSEGKAGWSLNAGEDARMLILDTGEDAEDAWALARRHAALCYIGRDNTRSDRESYIVQYWTGSSGLTTTIRQVDCLLYDPKALRIVDEGSAGWLLTDGRSRMRMLDDRQDAESALTLAKKHTQHCFIGRSNNRVDREAYIVQYWR